MNQDEIIRMAREAGPLISTPFDVWCERFAAIVTAAERERIKVANASEIEKINVHIRVLEDAVAAERERVTFELVNETQRAVQKAVWAEREACAKIADEWATHEQKQYGNGGPGAAIRARGEE